jgi:hypothetical protein
MSYKKCDFPKMGHRNHTTKSNPKKTRELIKQRKKRESEWKKWLTG